ncbi:MAG: DNA-3-methyladenine glycosylase I [Treponemataceae bacterium]
MSAASGGDRRRRCPWTGDDPLYISYHDEEWGRPLHDDRKLFELLLLEGAQAGLSWITVLRKRENYRAAFDNFDPEKMALYDETKIAGLLTDAGIVRNRLKVNGFVTNAREYLRLLETEGSFDRWIWSFVEGKPIVNQWKDLGEIPAETPESTAMSKELKRRGFTFVGSTICYAFMQAAGLVDDHLQDCFRRER